LPKRHGQERHYEKANTVRHSYQKRRAVVDKVTVAMDGTMTFTFRNGAEVTA